MNAGPSERPLATLYVAAYNQERFVRAAVEGAFAQTWEPLEIVLSDDASSDGTFAIMQAMVAGYAGPHALVLNRNPENLGIPGHVDRIMALSHGALVIENAGDDVSVPHRAERLVAAWLGSGRRAMALHSAKRRLDEAGAVHDLVPEPNPLHRQRPLQLLRRPPDLHGASMAWAREVFEVFGPLGDLPLLEDYPICLRAATLGEIHYLEEPLVHYRTGGLSWRGAESVGHYALYGHRQKFLTWHLSFARAYLRDMERRAPPDAEACRAQCAKNIRDFGFEAALAGMRHRERLAALPGALASALRHRDPAPARQALKYLFDRPYMAWLDRGGHVSGV